MATVKSKTSIKIDELIDATVVSGYIDSSGYLILETEGGAFINAGFVGGSGSGGGGSEIEVSSTPPAVASGLPELWVDTGAIAAVVTPTWNALTLINGWSSYGGQFVPARYCKDSAGIVRVQGLITGGLASQGTPVAQLPEGFRPLYGLRWGTYQSSHPTPGTWEVYPNGTIQCGLGGNANGWISLDVISFPAEA